MEIDGLGGHEAVLTATTSRLRIACSGLVGAEYGSAASMGFEVLLELLRREHNVDFFSKRSYVYPEALIGRTGFTYHDCKQPRVDAVIERIPQTYAQWLALQVGNAIYMRRIMAAMNGCHKGRLYDVELFLGQWAYGRVIGVPVVSWVQGAPGSDSRSVFRHRETIRVLCGSKEYAKLRAYSAYRGSRMGQPPFHNTDASVCGSLASKEILVAQYGISPRDVHALPYPLDLRAFSPTTETASHAGIPELLWVGRIVPRKRLDLFLDAGAHLIRAGTRIKLTVIGGFPFASGYYKLIDGFPFPESLTYAPHLPRDEVRRRMQGAAVLVAPSEEEDFGSAVAEALACGTPVVLGPTNGTGEYMGRGGERFAEYCATSLAAAIERVLARLSDARDAVRAAAREAAVQNFAVHGIVDRLEEIMRSAQARERAGALST